MLCRPASLKGVAVQVKWHLAEDAHGRVQRQHTPRRETRVLSFSQFESPLHLPLTRSDSIYALYIHKGSATVQDRDPSKNPTMASKVPHLMTLADLSPGQIQRILAHSYYLKRTSLPWLAPQVRLNNGKMSTAKLRMPSQSLFNKSIALLFSKRSTRTRVSAETAALLLGGQTLFLGREDIQIGVNESVRDSARVIGGMCQGIFARVGAHEEIEVRPFCFLFLLGPYVDIVAHRRNSRGTPLCPS